MRLNQLEKRMYDMYRYDPEAGKMLLFGEGNPDPAGASARRAPGKDDPGNIRVRHGSASDFPEPPRAKPQFAHAGSPGSYAG